MSKIFQRKEVTDGVTKMNKDLYDHLQQGIEDLESAIPDIEVTSADTVTLVEPSDVPPLVGQYLADNDFGMTKTIDVTNNGIANCKIDGVSDDYENLKKIVKQVNASTEPVTLLFPYTGKAMLLSNEIRILRSNVTFDVYCDVTLTKTTFAENENMTVFNFSPYNRIPITNIRFIGHDNTINANGSSLGIKQTSHSQVAQGNGIRFQRVLGGVIKNVKVTNALCDGIIVYASKNVTIENCEVSNTVMDNGLTVMGLPMFTDDWTFDEYDDRCWNNIIIHNCTAHNNEDLGFSVSACHGVTFENCTSYQNGNADGYNAGGGFSAEILFDTKKFFEVDLDFDMQITFLNCKALNNNNYGFYTDVNGVTIDSCYVDKTVQNNSTDASGRNIRGGNGIFANGVGRISILNTTFKNTALFAICLNATNEDTTAKFSNVSILECVKGIYIPYVGYLYLRDILFKSVSSTPFYMNDGTKKKYAEIKNLTFHDCSAVFFGNSEFIQIEDIYILAHTGTTVVMQLAKADAGVVKNVKIYKQSDDTTYLTGLYIDSSCTSSVIVDDITATNANAPITDKRTSA